MNPKKRVSKDKPEAMKIFFQLCFYTFFYFLTKRNIKLGKEPGFQPEPNGFLRCLFIT